VVAWPGYWLFTMVSVALIVGIVRDLSVIFSRIRMILRRLRLKRGFLFHVYSWFLYIFDSG